MQTKNIVLHPVNCFTIIIIIIIILFHNKFYCSYTYAILVATMCHLQKIIRTVDPEVIDAI